MLSGSSLPLSLLLVAIVTAGSSGGVWAASLPQRSRLAPPPPSAEMLRALRYIQSLSQHQHPHPPVAPDNQQWEEEGEGQGEEGVEQQWLQAVLETLQESQREGSRLDTSKTRPHEPLSPALTSVSHRRRHRKYPVEQAELELGQGQGGWGNSLKRTNENAQDEQYTPQKLATLQSVFEELQKISGAKSKSENKRQSDYEDEEEEEGDGEGDEDEEEEEEEEDERRRRKMFLQDWEPMGEDEEEEQEMKDEDDEGESDRGELRRDYDDDDDDDDDDFREEDEYDDRLVKRSSQSGSVGRQGAGQADDLSSLVDYYVLSVLEQQEQRRRAAQEEEEEEEGGRGAAEEASLSLTQLLRISEQLGLSPDQLLELLKASSNPLPQQAPPRTPQTPRTPARTPARLQALPQTTYQLSKPARTPARVQAPPQTTYELKLHTGPAPAADTHSTRTHTHSGSRLTHTQEDLLSSPHARPLEAPEDVAATAEILHLLGLPALTSPQSQPQLQRPPVGRERQRSRAPPTAQHDSLQDLLLSQRSIHPLNQPADHHPAVVPGNNNNNNNDEDSVPLERLLLEEEGPEERGLPPRSAGADEEDELALRVLTRALEDYYLDQPDTETDTPTGAMETRQSEAKETEDGNDTDDQTLQRILGYFTPEQQHSSEMTDFS